MAGCKSAAKMQVILWRTYSALFNRGPITQGKPWAALHRAFSPHPVGNNASSGSLAVGNNACRGSRLVFVDDVDVKK